MNLSETCCEEYAGLAVAVINQARKDACRRIVVPTARHKNVKAIHRSNVVIAEARAWLKSDSDRPMSFKWYCQHMDADYDAAREAALKKVEATEAREI